MKNLLLAQCRNIINFIKQFCQINYKLRIISECCVINKVFIIQNFLNNFNLIFSVFISIYSQQNLMISVKTITTAFVIKAVSFFTTFFIVLKIKFQQNLNVNNVRAFITQEFYNHNHIRHCNQRICSHKKHCINCSKSYYTAI